MMHRDCRSHNPDGFCFECWRCEQRKATTPEQRKLFIELRATIRDIVGDTRNEVNQ